LENVGYLTSQIILTNIFIE